jgi:hypothetical protein
MKHINTVKQFILEKAQKQFIKQQCRRKKHEDPAIVTWEDSDPDHKFTEAIANHRVWELEAERNA